MRQIVYFSTAAERQRPALIESILAVSRESNARDEITGLLVAGGNRYLQLVEGPALLVGTAVTRIRRDERHVGMTILVDRTVSIRSFGDWSMAFAETNLGNGLATLGELLASIREQVNDAKLLERIDCFVATFVVPPPPDEPGFVSRQEPVASPWTLAARYQPGLSFDRSH